MERQKTLIAILVASTAHVASADDKLDVKVTESVAGDGRSIAPVTVSGGPKAQGKPLPPAQDAATISCTNAIGLAAPANGLPAVLAPVSTQAATLDCKAQFHGAEASFKLKVTVPPAGLYAGVPAIAKSTDGKIDVPVVVWDGKKTSAPGSLRAGASDGSVEISGGTLSLSVSGKAPRLVAIAMIDSTRAHVGAAFVPVIGVTNLPVESEAQSNVEVWIAGKWFGPVPTKGKIADVPIEVPPGITHAVARSTSSKGYVTDAVPDLKIPPRLRIGAVAATSKLAAGEKTLLAIAVAGADGRPAAANAKVVATATHGTLGTVESKGSGLWTVAFTASTTPGSEKISIHVDGDPGAGTADVPLDVGGGAASHIEVDAPSAVAPGADIVVPVRIVDASGNVLDPATTATATLGGTKVEIKEGAIHAHVPEHLPPSGLVTLEVDADGTRWTLALEPTSPAVSATLQADVDGRDAELAIVVLDKFGNLAREGTFEVAVTGGSVHSTTRTERAFRVRVSAAEHAAGAEIVVRANGQSLAQTSVQFDPPSNAFVVGAWAGGGWMDNLGALQSPRAALGLGLRRGGRIELGLLAGVEGITATDTTSVDVMGMPDSTDRTIQGLGVPIVARARVRITRWLGFALGAGIVPMRVKVELAPTVQPSDEDVATVFGVRGQVTADIRLGPGRLFAGASYGRAKLEAANAVGQLDGIGVVGGYEWWFGAFGQ